MDTARILAAAAVLSLLCACDGTGAAADVPLDVAFVHDRSEVPDDPGPADDVTAGDLAETADPGTADGDLADQGGGDEALADPGQSDLAAQDAPEVPDVPDDPGAIDEATADPGATDPVPTDPGAVDPGVLDPGTPDPGVPDPGVADNVEPYSKKAGEYCALSTECADGMTCVGSELTHPQCNPGCEIDTDCDKVAINANGQCTEVPGYNYKYCLWLCSFLTGGYCPGDGKCDGSACR